MNSELAFFNKIKNGISTVFDVGCRTDLVYTSELWTSHLFEPNDEYYDKIKYKASPNCIINNFGLSNSNETLIYYTNTESFTLRTKDISSDTLNTKNLKIVKSIDYVTNHNISHIDFLKIDTEGYEFKVLLGFETFLSNVQIIQFEYGGTYLDANIKLIDIINHLKQFGFDRFYRIMDHGNLDPNIIENYKYSNIVALRHKNNLKL